MRITCMGAAQTVTGSCYLVETSQTTFIVDCGMHQGRSRETMLNRLPFPFSMDKIDFMLLTHAHIDHSGRIPKLYLDGFRKDIYATKATIELCEIMLPDSGHIQEMEQEWAARKAERAGKPIEEPLYTMQDAIDSCRLFKQVRYDAVFTPSPDVRVIMRDAGHILGSAILEIWVSENGATGGETKIVFSGDLGNKNIPIMRDPTIVEGADYLVIESTYGDRLHIDHGDKVEKFVKIITDTIARGGNVVIPSFAVGRTQEIIYALNQEEEKYKDRRSAFMQTQVYVDSPMASSATKVFRENEDCYDEEAKQYIRNGDNPLEFPNLHFTVSADESKELNMSQESKVIISASGMCDAGRIKHHLKHNLWRPESSIIFVGFQAVGTLGRRISEGAKSVRIFDEEIAVHAHIETIEGFSGHADRDGLLAWIEAMKKKPVKILLAHGEAEVIEHFSGSIATAFGIPTHILKLDEPIIVGEDVEQISALTGKRDIPLPDGSVLPIGNTFGNLQSTLSSLTDSCKKELQGVSDKETRRSILAKYKKLLQNAAEEMLDHMQ
jgi:metallo-beta-lactamase family protein